MLAGALVLAGLFPMASALEPRWAVVPDNREAQLLADTDDGRLDQFTLIQAALIAGGVHDPLVWQQSDDRLRSYAEELRVSGRLTGSAEEQACAIHQFMHQRVLTTYDPSANDLADALRNGRFNCITSSTLYVALAAECGWQAAAYELPAHVLVVFDPEGAAVPVETTCPLWRASQSARALARPAAPAAPAGRLIAAVELLATYYHNRGVARLANGDFAAAVAANRTALRLDARCAAARQNLLAAWNNWALALAEAGKYEAALEKIEAGLAVAPGYPPLLENRSYIERRRDAQASPLPSAQNSTPTGDVTRRASGAPPWMALMHG